MAYRSNNAAALIRDDKKYIWHPFTQMADWAADDPSAPLVIESGRGVYLIDTDGRRYIDGVSSLWVTVHGHRKKEIDDAVKRQLGRIAHSTFLGLTHAPAIELAKELVAIAPGKLSRVFYSDNGSTSVEIALKMAYQYWQQTERNSRKKYFLSLRNAYHGDTIGSVSVGGTDLFHAKFRPLLFKTYFAPSPYCYRCPHGNGRSTAAVPGGDFSSHCRSMGCGGECLAETERLLRMHGKEIAAAVIEPAIQGASGMLKMPPGYVRRFASLCRRYGVLLICDEVATGFGRTGTMFAVEKEGVRPDFLCLSKGITGGYLPLAATLATERVYRGFLGKYEEFKTFFHGHTYTANPLACAAALANLRLFREEKIIARLQAKIRHLAGELDMLRGLPSVGDIRQLGMMTGIELVKDTITSEDFPPGLKIGARVCALCRRDGLIIRPLGNVIVLMPPLAITDRQISAMMRTVRRALEKIPLLSGN